MTASTAIVQIRALPSMGGRVLALQAMVFVGSTPLGGPLVGAVAEWFGARYSVALGAGAGVAAGLAGLLSVRRVERRADDPQGELSLRDPAIVPRGS